MYLTSLISLVYTSVMSYDSDSFAFMIDILYMRLVMSKPLVGVCDQVRLKPACSAIETSYRLEILI